MAWTEFAIRLAVARLPGAIGVAQRCGQRMTGRRTDALVFTGAALFVILGSINPGEVDELRPQQ